MEEPANTIFMRISLAIPIEYPFNYCINDSEEGERGGGKIEGNSKIGGYEFLAEYFAKYFEKFILTFRKG